jgi:predicted DNA-binding transcriptional regulator AlpA
MPSAIAILTQTSIFCKSDGDAMKVKGDLIMKKTNKSTLKINDVCYLLGISEIEVWNLIRAGAIPVMLKKGTVRIPEESFRDWFEFYHLGGVA